MKSEKLKNTRWKIEKERKIQRETKRKKGREGERGQQGRSGWGECKRVRSKTRSKQSHNNMVNTSHHQAQRGKWDSSGVHSQPCSWPAVWRNTWHWVAGRWWCCWGGPPSPHAQPMTALAGWGCPCRRSCNLQKQWWDVIKPWKQ